VRWLENEPAIERALQIIPNLETFVKGVSKEKIKIDTKSFSTVKHCRDDSFLSAKPAFLGFVAKQITPFLTNYQSEAPIAPFLFSDLSAMIRDMLFLFVKESVIQDANSVHAVNLKDEQNWLPLKKVYCGFAVKAELKS